MFNFAKCRPSSEEYKQTTHNRYFKISEILVDQSIARNETHKACETLAYATTTTAQ